MSKLIYRLIISHCRLAKNYVHHIGLLLIFMFTIISMLQIEYVEAANHQLYEQNHFRSEIFRLQKADNLIVSSEFNSNEAIEKFFLRRQRKQKPSISYDARQNAARFKVGGGKLCIKWRPRTSGKLFIQFETRFDTNWYKINRVDKQFVNAKFTRIRQDAIKLNGGAEPRCFDFQIRMIGYASETDPSGIAGLPTIRAYASSPAGGSDPLRYKNDLQPGGESGYFYYMQGVWIRETYEIDIDEGRIRVWMGDENIKSRLIISDPKDPKLGFPYNPKEEFVGVSQIQFGLNASSGYPTNGEYYYWHRNLIVSSAPIGL